jgi:hypothetical protein
MSYIYGYGFTAKICLHTNGTTITMNVFETNKRGSFYSERLLTVLESALKHGPVTEVNIIATGREVSSDVAAWVHSITDAVNVPENICTVDEEGRSGDADHKLFECSWREANGEEKDSIRIVVESKHTNLRITAELIYDNHPEYGISDEWDGGVEYLVDIFVQHCLPYDDDESIEDFRIERRKRLEIVPMFRAYAMTQHKRLGKESAFLGFNGDVQGRIFKFLCTSIISEW